MEHRSVEQLKKVSAYSGEPPCIEAMSQRDRLERWAGLLEQQGYRSLNAFTATEHQIPEIRNNMRCTNSPISVAFEDPVLRGEGLRNDTYGAATRFFSLSDGQLHNIICDCHYGSTISAAAAAWGVRAVISRTPRTGFLARAWQLLTS